MLQAKTEEQKKYIESILEKDNTCAEWGIDIDAEYENCLFIDDCITFDTMAKIVDYLRSVNKPKKAQLDMSIVAPNMVEPVKTWIAYKKEKGQSYKPTGFKTFYKKLCELSNNNPQIAMAIIEQSMQNNYAGIFPIRNNNNVNYGRETITDKIRRSVEESNEFSQQLAERIGSQQQADVCDGDNDEVW
jgi:hypothetical protein